MFLGGDGEGESGNKVTCVTFDDPPETPSGVFIDDYDDLLLLDEVWSWYARGGDGAATNGVALNDRNYRLGFIGHTRPVRWLQVHVVA